MNRVKSGGCGWALAGCSAVLLGVAVLLAAIALNRKQIEAVRVTLQNRYPTGQVAVITKRQLGVPGSILSVRLVTAGAVADGHQTQNAKALEIAVAARDALPLDRNYDNYEVLLTTSQMVVGVTVSKTSSFFFGARELGASECFSAGPPVTS